MPTDHRRAQGGGGVSGSWTLARDADGIGWLTIDCAGAEVNTLSQATLGELSAILDDLAGKPPRALVIRSGKPSGFIAGADVEEFTRLASPDEALALVRRGWDTMEKLARLPFPTAALIRGFCMGGGLELAAACRYRIAVDEPGTRMALPEVMLGILPGWGGVKRLPALIGPAGALDLMLTGRALDARKAKKAGLVDAAVPARVMENAARTIVLEAPAPHVPSFAQRLLNGPLKPVVARTVRRRLAAKARRDRYPAPWAILELWQKYGGDPFAPGREDPSSIAFLAAHPSTRNLIRLFGLQERLKALGRQSDFAPRRVHVVGAGTMGGDIAAWCALNGLRVTLQDRDAERIAPAIGRAGELFRKRLHDRLRARDAMDRLVPDLTGEGARQADVIIEAIFENLEAKQALFADLEKRAKPGAILATNTSSLRLSDIAAGMNEPGRLVGLHFFNPVDRMRLVEVVGGEATDPDWLRMGAAFVRAIDRLPLPVKDAPGFLVNRVLAPYLLEAFRLVDAGVAKEAIDAAAVDFGMPVGPIELADSVGLDICAAAGRSLAAQGETAPGTLAALVAAGKLGRKTGEGFYRWAAGRPQKGEAGRAEAGLVERQIGPYLAAAREAVDEGIVEDADLADAGLVFGTGFAPFRGGPLHYLATRADNAR
ncbi:MAG TPA: crotonase [Rhodocyclaceae bacterium]|nr:MAG: crotonase [Rhodocyclales bacterium CG_4_9_14_3_um_filter_68_10]HCX33200.1 crotonase [Rhodocyclaceae bacterium]